MIAPVRQCTACRKFKDMAAFTKRTNDTRFKRCDDCRAQNRRAAPLDAQVMAVKKERARERLKRLRKRAEQDIG